MTTAEKLYKTAKELPEPLVAEILDFAEYLKQKRNAEAHAPENLARRIQKRFNGIDAENLPIPPRQLSRTPPLLEE